jgi:chloride channel protein, CIC family
MEEEAEEPKAPPRRERVEAYLLRMSQRFAPSEEQRVFGVTLIAGGVCGLVAVLFHVAILAGQRLFIDRAMAVKGNGFIPWTIVTPVLGGLISGLALAYIVPAARGSGIPAVKAIYATRKGYVRFRDGFGKFFISVLQLGTGSSLGREGPTVFICTGVASALGRMFGLSARNVRRMIPVGAAAGIAAAFNAPIAAVTFTIEELVGDLDQTVLSGVVVAAAIAAVIERSVLGEHPVFEAVGTYELKHPSSLLIYALLGVAAAVVSVVFIRALVGLRALYRASSLPLWVQPATGGFVTGVLAVGVFALLAQTGVTGGGYTTLASALSGSLPLHVLGCLLLVKLVATVCSYSSGGCGGVFAPTLFFGGMLGGIFGYADVSIFGHGDVHIGAFALVGMGAVFAGVIRAPITSVLIVFEMTRGYGLVLPLMVANTIAYALARRWHEASLYEALLEQDGIVLPERPKSTETPVPIA